MEKLLVLYSRTLCHHLVSVSPWPPCTMRFGSPGFLFHIFLIRTHFSLSPGEALPRYNTKIIFTNVLIEAVRYISIFGTEALQFSKVMCNSLEMLTLNWMEGMTKETSKLRRNFELWQIKLFNWKQNYAAKIFRKDITQTRINENTFASFQCLKVNVDWAVVGKINVIVLFAMTITRTSVRPPQQ